LSAYAFFTYRPVTALRRFPLVAFAMPPSFPSGVFGPPLVASPGLPIPPRWLVSPSLLSPPAHHRIEVPHTDQAEAIHIAQRARRTARTQVRHAAGGLRRCSEFLDSCRERSAGENGRVHSAFCIQCRLARTPCHHPFG
jgi:hypothetical protein